MCVVTCDLTLHCVCCVDTGIFFTDAVRPALIPWLPEHAHFGRHLFIMNSYQIAYELGYKHAITIQMQYERVCVCISG
jgi:hypothetical protein